MHLCITIAVLLFMNSFGEAKGSPRREALTIPPCEQEMVRKAFIQASWPDFEHEPEPSQRYYDPIQKKCLTKVDEPCPEVNATCAPNSECRSRRDGHYIYRGCYCDSSETGWSNATIANVEKTYCGTRAGYGEECSDVPPYIACDPKYKLSCHNGSTCGCQDPSKMAYDATENRCRILADEECKEDDDCVDNAQCIPQSRDISKCQCPHGTSKEGLCYRGFLQECSADRPCNGPRSLKCTDGICRCNETLHQGYQDGKCAVLVGEKCTGSEEECVLNAECVEGVCKCYSGFSATPDHQCHESGKNHGEGCEKKECDFHKGLACVDGTCQCVDPTLKLDADTKICVAPIGSKCGILDIVGKGDGKCEGKDENTREAEVDNKYTGMGNSTTSCPHYYVACEKGRLCMQSDTGKSYCI